MLAVGAAGWLLAFFGDIRGDQTTIAQMQQILDAGILPLAREYTTENRKAIDSLRNRIEEQGQDIRELRTQIFRMHRAASLQKRMEHRP